MPRLPPILFAVLLCCCCCCAAAPPAPVPPTRIATVHRVANVGNGYCTWCATETLARHLGVRQLHGWTARRHKTNGDDGGGAYLEDVACELRRLKVRHQFWPYATMATLRTAIARNGGAVVALHDEPHGHAVLLVGLDAKWAHCIDSNNTLSVRRIPRAEFRERWKRGALTLERPAPLRPTRQREASARAVRRCVPLAGRKSPSGRTR